MASSFETNGKIVFSSSSQLIDQIRSQNQVSMEDWRTTDLVNTKKKFWEAGFATYEDIEYLCYLVLEKQTELADNISRRFPLVIIDECQDLSESQLHILQKLLEHKCNLHFVGDLNQGIYSFRNVNPELVRQFAEKNGFAQLKLSNNFRSLQPIVDFCGKLVEQSYITGRQYKEQEPICFYVTYEKKEINQLPDRFIRFINKQKITISESVILTRNNNTVAKLRPSVVGDLKNSMFPSVAIQIWKTPNITTDQINEALSCMGRFVARQYFSSSSANKLSHYCPDSIKPPIVWRLFLSDVISICCDHHELSNLEQTWGEWAKQFRNHFDNIINKCQSKYDSIYIDTASKESQYIAPKGESSKKVRTTLGVIETFPSQPIRITNFHQIKGETREAVMVVSSPTNQGGGEGFWKNWLVDKKSEGARFAYVASSRPSKLLVWAIPNPITDVEKEILEDLGLKYPTGF